MRRAGRNWAGYEGGVVGRDGSPVLLLTVLRLCLSRSHSSELSIGRSSWKSCRSNTLCSSLVSFMSPRIHASAWVNTAKVQKLARDTWGNTGVRKMGGN